VARLAPESNIIHLQPLQERDAQYLFYKEAFWKCKDMICSQEVEHWAKLFVQKCNGLPIAIVCIGRLLSFRVTTYMSTWEWFGLKSVCMVRFLHLGQNGLVISELRYLVGWFGLD